MGAVGAFEIFTYALQILMTYLITTCCKLSNEELYSNLPQEASKLLEVRDLDFQVYLIKMDFLLLLALTSDCFDALDLESSYLWSIESGMQKFFSHQLGPSLAQVYWC